MSIIYVYTLHPDIQFNLILLHKILILYSRIQGSGYRGNRIDYLFIYSDLKMYTLVDNIGSTVQDQLESERIGVRRIRVEMSTVEETTVKGSRREDHSRDNKRREILCR